jgi:hypothetical protein
MKKVLLSFILGFVFSGSGFSQPDDKGLDGYAEDKEDYRVAMLSFHQGKATNAEEYFFGILAQVIWIDVKYNAVEYLDSANVSPTQFKLHFDFMNSMIEDCKRAMKTYEGRGWVKQKELQDLTVEWLDAMMLLVNDYMRPLAEAMSLPKTSWTTIHLALYEKFLLAREDYFDVDNRWVDFQYVYAAANGFDLSDETIDLDPLIQEDIRD